MAFEEKNKRLAERIARLKDDIEVIRRERQAISRETEELAAQVNRVKSLRPSEIPTKPGQTSPVFHPMNRAQVRHVCRGLATKDFFERYIFTMPKSFAP